MRTLITTDIHGQYYELRACLELAGFVPANTGSAYGGKLTVMELETRKYWQI